MLIILQWYKIIHDFCCQLGSAIFEIIAGFHSFCLNYYLSKNMQKYKTLKTLGDGAFGTVYKAQNIKTGEIVAIKKMKQKYTSWNECIELREIKSLRKLSHSGLIKLKEVLLVSDELYMVFEYLDYNLYEVYSKMKEQNKKFTENQIKSMVFQIVNGLAHMHKNGFFHRDMKPENLLIYNNIVKICDMGLAREIRSRPPFTDYVSTRWYRAPELLLRSTNYNSPVDVFALGCIIAQLYNLSPLFPGNNEVDQLNKIVKILGTPDKNDWPEGYKLAQARGYFFPQEKGVNLSDLIPDASLQAIDLLESMLQYSSRKRPTSLEILKHQYFKGVSLPVQESGIKQVIFDEKPTGAKLDTSKQDKNIDLFRATKQKFKQTRRHDAIQNNPLKNMDKSGFNYQNKPISGGELDDLDSLIKELQEKGNKKRQSKLPFLNTREKFQKNQKKQLRQSKTELKHGQPYKHVEKQDWKFMRNEDSSYKNKLPPSSKIQLPPSKKEMLPGMNNKFSYNFQPATIPTYQLPGSKHASKNIGMNMGLGLGHLPLPKPIPKSKLELLGGNHYKF